MTVEIRYRHFILPKRLKLSLRNLRLTINSVNASKLHPTLACMRVWGGNKGDIMTMYSPNDPIFYLHHAFIDLLWNEWQQRHPQLARTYDGSSGASVSIKDNLPPFDIPVRSVLDTTSQCYKYPRYGADLPNTSTLTKLKRRQVNEGEDSDMNNIVKAALEFSEPVVDFAEVGSGTSLLEGLNLDFSMLQPIAALDRTSRNKIRATRPIPEEYLNRNNIDVPTTRLIELELNTLAAAYNALTDFIPQAQLIDA
ncbi:Tyrosinase [Entomophthora muscae]|uniref:Tyrosinase n=1 Tax=Entomophthora muscae TaxID=34485 RepID=A0ACC2U6R3_9FUNG|nr:Tyrosinase [Entomophthora muscae]